MNQTITTYFRLTEKEKHPSLKKKTESTPNPSSFAGSRPQNQEATADSHLELSILNKQRAGKRYVRIYRLFSLYYFRCMLYCFRCILNQYVIIFKKENCRLISAVFNMVEVTRFELATSSSRTKRATKLRHTSKNTAPRESGPLAAELGFEPRHTESESAVLPLHNSASHFFIITKISDMSSAKLKKRIYS